MARNKRCFLSSTFTSLVDERQAARDAIDRAGYRPIMMESFSTDSVSPAKLIADLIQTSGVVVLVLADRLGSKDRETGKFFVELEYEAAIEAGVPVHVFLSSEKRLVPEQRGPRNRTEQSRLAKLRRHVQMVHTVRHWATAAELTLEVFVSLSQRRSVRQPENAKKQASYENAPTTAPLSPIADYSAIVEWYQENIALFDKQRERLEKELRVTLVRMLRSAGLSDFNVYSRTKSPLSLSGKLERPRRNERFASAIDIHDLIGLRVVMLHEIEVERVSDELRRTLPDAKLEVKAPADPLAFGYRSHHITASVNQQIAGKHGFRYEIQVRTLLQHTWAQIEHRLGYKSTVYDDESRRVFAQVSALLEVADNKFSELRSRQEDSQISPPKEPGDLHTSQRPSALRKESAKPATPQLTEQAIQAYFLDSEWDKSPLSTQILSYGLAFSVDITNTKARSQDFADLFVFLQHRGVATVQQMHEYLSGRASHLFELIKDLHVRLEFSEVTPLFLLWLVALTVLAQQSPAQANAEVRATLDHFNLFLEEDRDAVADLVSTKLYLS